MKRCKVVSGRCWHINIFLLRRKFKSLNITHASSICRYHFIQYLAHDTAMLILLKSTLTSCKILFKDSTSVEWANSGSNKESMAAVGLIGPSETLELAETGRVESSEVRLKSCCRLILSSLSLSACKLWRINWATSEFWGSLSRPIWNFTRPEVFRKTEAA